MKECAAYIEEFLSYENPILRELETEHHRRDDVAPNIGIHVGTFLAWLIRVMQAKRVLEFGTCLGYSTVFLGEALRETGGKLTAIESEESLFRAAERNVAKADLSGIVHLIHGDAATVIDELEGPFDLILQDAAKALYPAMLEKCILKTRPLGVIAADDALFRPMGVEERLSKHLHQYNQMVFSDPRLLSTILPIGDGLVISTKK